MEFTHIHNNNGDAEKAKIALFNSCTYIDTTIAGLGRGVGNWKTEDFYATSILMKLINLRKI